MNKSDQVAPSKGAMRAAERLRNDGWVAAGKRSFGRMAEIIDRETKSPQMAERIRRSKEEHFDMAALLDAWAMESVQGGWSTHQIDAMRRRADKCRKYGAEAESLLSELEGKL